MTPVFAVMHLYNILEFVIAFVHFFFILLKNLVFINRRNGPRYKRVLALCAFLTGVIPKGTNSSKILCSMFVYVLFCLNLCTGLILWFLNNLWFDDLRAE